MLSGIFGMNAVIGGSQPADAEVPDIPVTDSQNGVSIFRSLLTGIEQRFRSSSVDASVNTDQVQDDGNEAESVLPTRTEQKAVPMSASMTDTDSEIRLGVVSEMDLAEQSESVSRSVVSIAPDPEAESALPEILGFSGESDTVNESESGSAFEINRTTDDHAEKVLPNHPSQVDLNDRFALLYRALGTHYRPPASDSESTPKTKVNALTDSGMVRAEELELEHPELRITVEKYVGREVSAAPKQPVPQEPIRILDGAEEAEDAESSESVRSNSGEAPTHSAFSGAVNRNESVVQRQAGQVDQASQSSAAERVEQIESLNEAKRSAPMQSLTLKVEDASGENHRIRVDLRGSEVAADIVSPSVMKAGLINEKVAELRNSLSEQGLEATVIQIRTPTGSGGTSSGTDQKSEQDNRQTQQDSNNPRNRSRRDREGEAK